MTNLLNLPQFPAGVSFTIAFDGDWNDQIYVPQPGYPAQPISVVGQMNASAPHISGLTAPPLVLPGMLAVGVGVPGNVTASAVTANSITLSAAPAFAAPSATVDFYGPPLDLTGITFTSYLRVTSESALVLIEMSTATSGMVNGGAGGQFGWNVPAAKVMAIPFPPALPSQGSISCVLDVIATDATGARVNLCATNGPLPVTVILPVTR